MIEKIKHLLGDLKDKTIGVLGLAFKQNIDDVLQSPSLDVIKLLLKEGARINCFNPPVIKNTRKILSTLTSCPILINLRNLYEPSQVKASGFIYERAGRR